MPEQLYSPDGGNTWLTAAQMQARGLPLSQPNSSSDGRVPPGNVWGFDGILRDGYGRVLFDPSQPTQPTQPVAQPVSQPVQSQPIQPIQQSQSDGQVYLQDPNTGRLMPFQSTYAIDYQLALKSGFTPVSGSTGGAAQTTTPTGDTPVTLQSPTGQKVQVTLSDPLYQQYLSSGFTPIQISQPTQSQPQPTQPQNTQPQTGQPFTPWDSNQALQQLQAAGYDTSQLSPNQVQWLGGMLQSTQVAAANDQKVPASDNIMQTVSAYLTQAKSYLDPRYEDQWNQYSTQVKDQLSMLTGQVSDQEQAQRLAFQQQQEGLAKQMAEAGLAQSGIRRGAETQLQSQQEGLVRSNRRELQQKITSLGRQAEQVYGTRGAGTVTPVTSGAYPQQNISSQQIGYNPMGVQFPSAVEAQNQGVINLAQQQLSSQGLSFPQIPAPK